MSRRVINVTFAVPSEVVVTIEDDDDLPTVSLDVAAQEFLEPAGPGDTATAMIQVNITPVSGRDVVFSIASADGFGSATVGEDYTALNEQVTIPAGQPSVLVPIDILGDNLIEGPEEIPISLTAAFPAN